MVLNGRAKIKWQQYGSNSEEKEDQVADDEMDKIGDHKANNDGDMEEEEEEESSPDDTQEYFPMTTSITRELKLELENLDRQVFGVDGCGLIFFEDVEIGNQT